MLGHPTMKTGVLNGVDPVLGSAQTEPAGTVWGEVQRQGHVEVWLASFLWNFGFALTTCTLKNKADVVPKEKVANDESRGACVSTWFCTETWRCSLWKVDFFLHCEWGRLFSPTAVREPSPHLRFLCPVRRRACKVLYSFHVREPLDCLARVSVARVVFSLRVQGWCAIFHICCALLCGTYVPLIMRWIYPESFVKHFSTQLCGQVV